MKIKVKDAALCQAAEAGMDDFELSECCRV